MVLIELRAILVELIRRRPSPALLARYAQVDRIVNAPCPDPSEELPP